MLPPTLFEYDVGGVGVCEPNRVSLFIASAFEGLDSVPGVALWRFRRTEASTPIPYALSTSLSSVLWSKEDIDLFREASFSAEALAMAPI